VAGAGIAQRSLVSDPGWAKVGNDRPAPVLGHTPYYAPSAALAEQRPLYAHSPQVTLRFGLAAGHGVTAEMVTDRSDGLAPVKGLAGFLLAPPDQDAEGVIAFGPDSALVVDSAPEKRTWKVEARSASQSTEAFGFRIPAEIADAFGATHSEISIPRLNEAGERIHWIRERDGAAAGVGVRIRVFPHSVAGNKVTPDGLAGTGTNWLSAAWPETPDP
jgi:hypothetical protein